MLSIGDARRLIDTHLGATPRAAHSVLVGKLMRGLALARGVEPALWEVTGLCHDLDFEAVNGDWSQHGLVAAAWLEDDLPVEALDAIRAHDHRTGLTSDTLVAHGLKLADALAVANDQVGEHLGLLLPAKPGELERRLHDRPYLSVMIRENATSLGISPTQLAAIVVSATVTLIAATPEAASFSLLREQCSAEGLRMLDRFEEDWRDGTNRFDQPGELAVAAGLAHGLIGLCGRNRDPYDPHPRAGRVRHLYVAAPYRGLGVGRLLVETVIDGASNWFDHLNTNCPPEAAPFYERLGFRSVTADRITHRLQLR